ncbi:MAG: hypothetical protein IAE97_07490 [Chthoniobacterales bacterium]|nr:hypothetical protein [Chthoniobacterales bacterium]
MRNLTQHAVDHDDPASKQHAKDKKEKRERGQTTWEPVPTLSAARGRIVEGITPVPAVGFCFKMRRREACRAAGDEYTSATKAMERTRRRGVRIRIREGKERRDTVRYRCGAQSLLATAPPWSWGLLKEMPASQRDHLMLCLAEKAAARIQEISGRETWGGGVHYDANSNDSFFPHLHLHIPKVSGDGTPYPKASFITTDDWTANTLRIEQHFPGLLSEGKVANARRNLEKKGDRPVIDLEIQRVMDRELETFFRQEGLCAKYEQAKKRYAGWKRKEEEQEPQRRLIKAGLSYHHRTGLWPLAYRAMKLTAWRLIPRELRAGIMISIRATQIVEQPLRSLQDIRRLAQQLTAIEKSPLEKIRMPQL